MTQLSNCIKNCVNRKTSEKSVNWKNSITRMHTYNNQPENPRMATLKTYFYLNIDFVDKAKVSYKYSSIFDF